MPSINRLRVLRSLERFMMLFLTVWIIALTFLAGYQTLSPRGLVIGGVIALLMVLVIFFIQRNIDAWVGVALSQSSYVQDDAFTALFESSPVPYLIIDKDGVIAEANPAAIKLLQGEVNTIAGVNFFGLMQPDEQTDPTVLAGKLSAGITLNDIEIPIMTLRERLLWVILSVFTYRHSDQRLIALVDMTEQKQVDTAKSEFVALATHQLRTPIAAIRWNVELLQKNLKATVTEVQSKYLTKIERNVLRMLSLINDFLSVSKLEMGTYAASEEDTNLGEFFSSIIDEFAGKITEKGIQLQQRMDPPQVVIRTDSRLFHIIVSNLMSNAVKYLQSQGTLQFSYVLQGGTLVITVADNGIGIPEVELERLFTKFYRASNAQKHQTEGTGLGLYIVKQSVEQLGGTITVQSAENAGATFVVTLPVHVVST